MVRSQKPPERPVCEAAARSRRPPEGGESARSDRAAIPISDLARPDYTSFCCLYCARRSRMSSARGRAGAHPLPSAKRETKRGRKPLIPLGRGGKMAVRRARRRATLSAPSTPTKLSAPFLLHVKRRSRLPVGSHPKIEPPRRRAGSGRVRPAPADRCGAPP